VATAVADKAAHAVRGLRVLLRRRAVDTPPQEPVHLADLVLDVPARRCTLHHQEIALHPKEFDLLAVPARHAAAVTRDLLMVELWDENWFGSTKNVDVTMAGLRRRLTEASRRPPAPAACPASPHRTRRPPTHQPCKQP
jgi:DNA-binding response OmpR family regulator